MTACADLYKKVKKCGNFCGLGDNEFRKVTKYLDFVEEFTEKYDFTEEFVYSNCPRNAAYPILKFKRGSDIRAKAMSEINDTLKDGRSISRKFVEVIMGVAPPMKKIPPIPVVPKSAIPTEALTKNSVKDKVRLITSAIPEMEPILMKAMDEYQLNNEYEAICKICIEWSKSRK
jgi:hypothetical protein